MNEAAHIPFNWILLIPILGIVGATICGSLTLLARYKQRMVILKTGIKPEEKSYKRERLLIAGTSIMAIGLGFLAGVLTKNMGFAIAFIFLFVGIGLALGGRSFVKKSTPAQQQTSQRREIMRALLKQLEAFKKTHDTVVITLIINSDRTGDIKQIMDDELVEFKEKDQEEPTYIPIDKIISVRKIC